MKISERGWSGLLLIRLIVGLCMLAIVAACRSADDESDSREELSDLLNFSAILNETRVRVLTTVGVGLSGSLANPQARERYAFNGSVAAHLLVLYAASAVLDGAMDLSTAAGRSVASVDRRTRGLVGRREVILSSTQYLLIVRAFTGTAGSYRSRFHREP